MLIVFAPLDLANFEPMYLLETMMLIQQVVQELQALLVLRVQWAHLGW